MRTKGSGFLFAHDDGCAPDRRAGRHAVFDLLRAMDVNARDSFAFEMIRIPSPPLLLASGVAASATFVAADLIVSPSVDGYSITFNSISELLVPGMVPTLARIVAVALMSISDIFGIIFGFCGLLQAANCVVDLASRSDQMQQRMRNSRKGTDPNEKIPFEQRLQIRLSMYRGGMLLGTASFCNVLSALIFPQDVRGTVSTFSGRMHLILVGMSVLLSLVAMYLLSWAISSHSFQQFTVLVVSLMFAGGVCAPLAEGIGILGIAERTAAYAYVIWQAVLSILLICISS